MKKILILFLLATILTYSCKKDNNKPSLTGGLVPNAHAQIVYPYTDTFYGLAKDYGNLGSAITTFGVYIYVFHPSGNQLSFSSNYFSSRTVDFAGDNEYITYRGFDTLFAKNDTDTYMIGGLPLFNFGELVLKGDSLFYTNVNTIGCSEEYNASFAGRKK